MQDCIALCKGMFRYVNFVWLQNRVEHRFCKLFQLKYFKIFFVGIKKRGCDGLGQCSVRIIFPQYVGYFWLLFLQTTKLVTKKLLFLQI